MGDPQMTMVDDSATKLRLKCKPWDSLTLLSGCACAFDSGQLPDQLVRQTWGWSSLRELLWHEVCSEYDARHFLAHSLRRGGSMSADFSRFKDLWLAEENNHYLGFRRLYQRLTLMSETRLDRQLMDRAVSFHSMDFVVDEFSTCVLLAYDEMVTSRAYPLDYPIYDSFGDAALSRWIRKVCRDEVYHCCNVVAVLRRNHLERFDEIPSLIDEIADASPKSAAYGGTFALDHQGFPKELLGKAKAVVIKMLARPRGSP